MTSSAETTVTAFGLDMACATPLSFLSAATAAPTGRVVNVSTRPGETARAAWPADAELICDETLPDGSVNFRIETHSTAGYLIWGPQYGAHLLAADGSRLQCFPEDRPDGDWQRLLIAQVLPFAALLHGLEVFHASAVACGDTAIALLGPSGTGKTSMALELCERGASFLADDVLALERADGDLLAHPGSPVAGVARAGEPDDGSVDGSEGPRQRPVIATNARERIVGMRGAAQPVPLSALLFVERRRDGPDAPQFTAAADALSLLSATFNFVLATPERLKGLLDVCALAARLRVEQVVVGPRTDIPSLVDAIERRLGLP